MAKRKFAEGGEVGSPDRPEEQGPRGLLYNRYLQRRRQAVEREKRSQPENVETELQILRNKKANRGPTAGGSERLAKEAASDETARRSRVADAQRSQRFWERVLDEEGTRIGQRRDPTRVEDNGYKAGGWIQKAIKKPGALRAQLDAKPGQKIPAKKLSAAAKAPGKLGQRARLAQTLGKMNKKKK
jgi:hypothetical protein